jgi:hypothetical protein
MFAMKCDIQLSSVGRQLNSLYHNPNSKDLSWCVSFCVLNSVSEMDSIDH